MWVRKRIDIGWSDLGAAVLHCLRPFDRAAAQRELERAWSGAHDALACLSVRSGFDLLLGTLDLPPGSEILVSAVTIPDMVRIIREHGLVPVPVDVEIESMAPKLERVQAAVTPATRAILVAHLCGGRFPVEPLAEVASQHGLLLFEDCAQAFAGPGYRGDPAADVSMFSFGPIKTATSLGGALLRVRDRDLLGRMRARQAAYPVQSRPYYLRRLAKFAAMKVGAMRPVLAAIVALWKLLGRDADRMINGTARGFPGPAFFSMIRRQPSAPLLSLMRRRLRRFDADRLARRTDRGEFLTGYLDGRVTCPGTRTRPHTHWVFPVLADNPGEVIAALGGAGFDATQGQSMCVVAPPADRPELDPTEARLMLAKTVYLPFYPEMPEKPFRRMIGLMLKELVPASVPAVDQGVEPVGRIA